MDTGGSNINPVFCLFVCLVGCLLVFVFVFYKEQNCKTFTHLHKNPSRYLHSSTTNTVSKI